MQRFAGMLSSQGSFKRHEKAANKGLQQGGSPHRPVNNVDFGAAAYVEEPPQQSAATTTMVTTEGGRISHFVASNSFRGGSQYRSRNGSKAALNRGSPIL